mgnify:FL=1
MAKAARLSAAEEACLHHARSLGGLDWRALWTSIGLRIAAVSSSDAESVCSGRSNHHVLELSKPKMTSNRHRGQKWQPVEDRGGLGAEATTALQSHQPEISTSMRTG